MGNNTVKTMSSLGWPGRSPQTNLLQAAGPLGALTTCLLRAGASLRAAHEQKEPLNPSCECPLLTTLSTGSRGPFLPSRFTYLFQETTLHTRILPLPPQSSVFTSSTIFSPELGEKHIPPTICEHSMGRNPISFHLGKISSLPQDGEGRCL